MILSAVPGKESCRKALSTCGCHPCVVPPFRVPGIAWVRSQPLAGAVSVRRRVLLAQLYLSLPAAPSALEDSLRARQPRRALLGVLCPSRVRARCRWAHLGRRSPSCLPSECTR
ncbi:hypothetical protein DUI87_34020 [Hirundo rustica rustica]|uniref:Uncharacterized protein n=1 Tax=Hirundo rustica rustica TaxID=333673 RepID=A0A3M0IKQ1_HIRRU|nr:hypothetical protein DUI87_34020 [Hirundo rustica rustica]